MELHCVPSCTALQMSTATRRTRRRRRIRRRRTLSAGGLRRGRRLGRIESRRRIRCAPLRACATHSRSSTRWQRRQRGPQSAHSAPEETGTIAQRAYAISDHIIAVAHAPGRTFGCRAPGVGAPVQRRDSQNLPGIVVHRELQGNVSPLVETAVPVALRG